jgi:hypothetical protein
MDRLDIKMCNCAKCGKELLGLSMAAYVAKLAEETRKTLPPVTAGKIDDRPYCKPCFSYFSKKYLLRSGTSADVKPFDLPESLTDLGD